MGQVTLVINSLDSANSLNAFVDPQEGNQMPTLAGIENLSVALQGGLKDIQDGLIVFGVPATGAVTFTGRPAANGTVTINGVVFTAKDSGATGNEFNTSATVATTATNLAAKINAATDDGIAGCITASASAGVVTLTALVTGKLGLGYTVIDALTNATVSAFSVSAAETSRTTF